MWRLSNFLRVPEGLSKPAVRFSPAGAARQREALALLMGQDGLLADMEQVDSFLSYLHERRIDPADIWIAEACDQLAWALFPVVAPGRSALLLTPDASLGPPAFLSDFAATVCEAFEPRGVRFFQVLTDVTNKPIQKAFEACGFSPMAELVYLMRPFRKELPKPGLPPGMGLLTYSPETHARFARTIEATYEQSLDCPALDGVRAIDDVIAGHKATGVFDPAEWFLLHRESEDLAVLLLNRTPNNDGVELVYLGITPKARGQGLGDFLMQLTGHHATRNSVGQLTVAVDGNNAPALRLYFRHGLKRITSKLAMMRVTPTAR